MKKLAFLVLTTLVVSCGNATQSNADNQTEATPQTQQITKNVSVQEFNQLMKEKPKAQILDVRSAEEFRTGYIAGAVNINVMESGFEQTIAKLDKNKPVLVYCAAGGRSAKAMSILYKNGFTEVYNMNGGMGAWNAAGLPITK
ncbi:MAG: rhodanese-like domain-containing protein [Flavobacteriales bacterium]